jgi:hypothetical protein
METLMSEIKRKIGRPPKNELSANTKRNAVGRPKGDAAIINEYKARMLSSPKSRKVLDAIFDAALDNEHKNQAAAWKLIVDRIVPVSSFEQDVIKQSGRSAIQINITGLGASVSEPETVNEVTDIEIKDV